MPIVLFCKETTLPGLKPDHTHLGQPIIAVAKRKFHHAEYYNLVVKVAENKFQTLPASECGGRSVIAKLSDDILAHKQPKSFDEVAQMMGARSGSTPEEKQKAVDQALGEERGLRWVSCDPVPLNPTNMSRMLLELYWRGPNEGSAVLTKSTLLQLAGKNPAQKLINQCAGLEDKEDLLMTVSKAYPAIEPTRDLDRKFNQLVLSSQRDESVRSIRPVTVGYHKPVKDQKEPEPSRNQDRDGDVEMPDALGDVVKAPDGPDVTSKEKEKEDTDVDMLASPKAAISEAALKDPDATTAIRDVAQPEEKGTLAARLKAHAPGQASQRGTNKAAMSESEEEEL